MKFPAAIVPSAVLLDASADKTHTAPKRLEHLDALRLVLTVLVIVHHTVITYGAGGSWFYTEPSTWTAWSKGATVFVVANTSPRAHTIARDLLSLFGTDVSDWACHLP